MPEFVTPDRVRLSLDSGRPTVSLTGVSVTSVDGWSVVDQATLLVLNGPGDQGFLVGKLGLDGSRLAPEGWAEAVERNGGVDIAVDGGTTLRAARLVA